jgi:hypothetical protein
MHSYSLWLKFLVPPAIGVVTAGCLPIGTGGDKPKPGSLGNAVFAYECNDADSKGDPYCDLVADTSLFPKVAVGARFVISAETKDNDSLESSTLLSASNDRIKSEGGDFWTALEPGVTSIITTGDNDPSVRSSGGKPKELYLDYIDVDVEPATGIALTQITVGNLGNVTGTIGDVKGTFTFGVESTYLRAQPIDDAKEPVAGTLPDPYVWKSSNPNVVSVTMGVSDHIVSITPMASGSSTLTVTVGQLSSSLTMEVK